MAPRSRSRSVSPQKSQASRSPKRNSPPGSPSLSVRGKMHNSYKKSYVDMIVEALVALKDRQGSSTVAIRRYIETKYPDIPSQRLPGLLKQAYVRGTHNGVLSRPPRSKSRGATGRFILNEAGPKSHIKKAKKGRTVQAKIAAKKAAKKAAQKLQSSTGKSGQIAKNKNKQKTAARKSQNKTSRNPKSKVKVRK